jgi:signal transduction histidine kinase
MDAIGGRVQVVSSERSGTTVTAVIPRTDQDVTRASQTMPLTHQVV